MQVVQSFANRFARNITEARFPSLWRGLVGCWMPSAGIQASKLRDFSNTGNHAAVHGLVAADWRAGRRYSGRGLNCDNVDNYADVQSPRKCGITADITLMFWTRRRTTGAYGQILVKATTPGDLYDYILYFQTTNPDKLSFYSNATGLLIGATSVGSGVWSHCAFTRIGSAWRVYLNGRADGSGTNGTAFADSAGSYVSIGSGGLLAANYFHDGEVDDLRIYNRGLSPQEIAISAAGWTPLTLREDLRRAGKTAFGNTYQMFI